jgi:hypothetical protein
VMSAIHLRLTSNTISAMGHGGIRILRCFIGGPVFKKRGQSRRPTMRAELRGGRSVRHQIMATRARTTPKQMVKKIKVLSSITAAVLQAVATTEAIGTCRTRPALTQRGPLKAVFFRANPFCGGRPSG